MINANQKIVYQLLNIEKSSKCADKEQDVTFIYPTSFQMEMTRNSTIRLHIFSLYQDYCIIDKATKMLKFQKGVPVKQTSTYLAKFPRFSLIEKISPKFYATSGEASIAVARLIKQQIQKKNNKGETFVLGLATGSTPIAVYKELIRLHKSGDLSFRNVVTFNLDEYYPIKKNDPESYNYYMNYHLFNHIDIPRENINIPNGQIKREDVVQFCADYEKKIQSYGGIDIQILGIGRTGHIGFNQPPSPINSITRLVYLHRITRKDAATSFGGLENVPKCAVSMGIDTIRKAKKIIIMAWSESKAYIVKKSIQGEFTSQIPSTFLHQHPDASFYLDKAAGQLLTRFNTPWVIKGDIEDPIVPKSPYWVLKSIMWLCLQTQKSILRLTYDDYEDHHLSSLVMNCANGSVEDLNLYCYKKIIKKITGWPLGNRPLDSDGTQLAVIAKKSTVQEKILIFSPHPDDDVISMGGTMKKLKDQGHQIHIAYMTSGANGVFDYEAQKYLYFLKDFSAQYFWNLSKLQDSGKFIGEYNKILDQAEQNFSHNMEQMKQTQFNMMIKKYIRNSQAKIAVSTLGLNPSNVYNLQLPFYGTHNKAKEPVGQKDYEIVKSLLRLIQPTIIFAAGDLTDPHATHRRCLELLLHLQDEEQKSIKNNPSQKPLFPPSDKIYFYRGAWEEWTIPMCRAIVPLSPKDVEDKFAAIIKHQSQKQNPMFPGDDKRPFWERVQSRNRQTAQILNKLGFSQYEGCECFVTLNDFKNFVEI